MKSLILMYLYFDKNGDIKAITPALSDALADGCFFATFPLHEVEPFLTGAKNTFEYKVEEIVGLAGVRYKIKKKVTEIAYKRTLNNYLTKIDETFTNESTIIIINDTKRKKISISATSALKDLLNLEVHEIPDSVSNFLSHDYSNIYITRKNNPYNLLCALSFSHKEVLLKDALYFDCEESISGTSAYAKKIISGYTYREKIT